MRKGIKPLLAAQSADHCAERAGSDRFFQRPEQVFFMTGANRDEPGRIDAQPAKPVAIKHPVFLRFACQRAETQALARSGNRARSYR